MKAKLDNLYYLMLNTTSECIKNKYLAAKKEYRCELYKAKLDYNSNIINSAKNKSKASWGLINRSRGSRPLPVIHSNLTAENFNSYFISSVERTISEIVPGQNSHNVFLDKLNLNGNFRNKFTFSEFKVEEVYLAINSLSNSTSLDIYGINATMLKLASKYVCEVLTYLFNECINQGVFPDKLKINKVVPVYKKGEKANCSNYRPISIVPTISKVFERLVHTQIVSYLESCNLFSSSQYGFRSNHSTIEAVMSLLSGLLEGLELNNSVLFRSFDMSKAFDTVDHGILINKLSFYNFDDTVVDFLNSYLSNRWQSVFLNGCFSSKTHVKYGVPQGSILGPTLFILYINDLPASLNRIDSKCFLFADDLGLCVQGKSLDLTNSVVNIQTNLIQNWCTANKLKLNSCKTHDLLLNLSNSNDITNLKFLGILLQSNLKWQQHIDLVASRMAKGLFLIRSLSGIVEPSVSVDVYYAHVHSHLAYGTALWANSSCANKIFILQKRAIRLICKVPNRTHCKPLFVDLGVLSLPSLYVLSTLLYIKRILPDLTANADVHGYSTRKNNDLAAIRCKYSLTKSSFLQQGIKLFNALPIKVRSEPYKMFKAILRKFLLMECLYKIEDFFDSVTRLH
jgi:hypothetical protein